MMEWIRHLRDGILIMQYSYLQLGYIFMIYSFLGWMAGVAAGAVRRKHFHNTGFMIMPLCPSYGLGAVIISVLLEDLKGQYIFLFIGGAVIGSVVCITTGVFLERILHKKWWDYSKGRFQFDGYLELWHFIAFGFAAIAITDFINPFIVYLIRLTECLPDMVLKVLLLVSLVFVGIDILINAVTLLKWRISLFGMEKLSATMESTTVRLGNLITERVRRRIVRAYPLLDIKTAFKKNVKERFAQGCCFFKLFWLFVIAAFLGDVIEMVFCRITMGAWMSRSSLVIGHFSVVWGLGCSAFTAFLYKHRDRPVWALFLEGTILGGVYEYSCSVVTEILFGTVFWDYSGLPFNLGGRINLLYCMFWGVAAILWFKVVYPFLSSLIERVPVKAGNVITWVCIVLMTSDMAVSGLALARYRERQQNETASNSLEVFLDETFDDEMMHLVYPKAKFVDSSAYAQESESN